MNTENKAEVLDHGVANVPSYERVVEVTERECHSWHSRAALAIRFLTGADLPT